MRRCQSTMERGRSLSDHSAAPLEGMLQPMIPFTRETSARVEALLHDHVLSAAAVAGGYSPAARWLVTLGAGGKVFVKMGTTPYTADALRAEADIYQRAALPCMPRFSAWEDHPNHPLLLLEDLSAAAWPPRGIDAWSTKCVKR